MNIKQRNDELERYIYTGTIGGVRGKLHTVPRYEVRRGVAVYIFILGVIDYNK
jgi:hypothetical protein